MLHKQKVLTVDIKANFRLVECLLYNFLGVFCEVDVVGKVESTLGLDLIYHIYELLIFVGNKSA